MIWALLALNKPGDRKADVGTAVPSCPTSLSGHFCSLHFSLSGRDTHWGVAGSLPPLAAVGMLFTHVVTKLLILFCSPTEAPATSEVLGGPEGVPEPLVQCTAWLEAYFREPAATEGLPLPALHHPVFQQGW